ncbi:MAG TPA: hypothetical protein VMU88_08080 [bacterium]|nr:hypothetical protein [bacterium]
MKNRDRIQKEFPHTVWSTVKSNREGNPEVLRIAEIPAADVASAPGKLFYFQSISDDDWVRDFTVGSYLLYSGLTAEEDLAKSPYAPIPTDMGGDLVQIRGRVVFPSGGTLRLKVTSANYAILSMDGKTVLDFRPWVNEETMVKTLEVSPGPHLVSYLAFLHMGNEIPQIKMSLNGQPEQLLGAPLETLGEVPAGVSGFHLGTPSH